LIRKILQSKLFTPVVLVLFGMIVLAIIQILPNFFKSENELAVLRQKIADTGKNLTELEQKKAFANSDAYLELQARQKLNYKMPDEKVVFIYKNQYNQEPEIASSSAENTANDVNIWQKILDWLKGK